VDSRCSSDKTLVVATSYHTLSFSLLASVGLNGLLLSSGILNQSVLACPFIGLTAYSEARPESSWSKIIKPSVRVMQSKPGAFLKALSSQPHRCPIHPQQIISQNAKSRNLVHCCILVSTSS
jgi:hypothetical protein